METDRTMIEEQNEPIIEEEDPTITEIDQTNEVQESMNFNT